MFGKAAARLCGAASLLLGWRPDEFWNCTPAELALAMNPVEPLPEAPDRKTIEALRQRFPDEGTASPRPFRPAFASASRSLDRDETRAGVGTCKTAGRS
jgi:uncharacterized phage protein (TIGR02216 family)